MKKVALILALMLVVSLSLVACGGRGGGKHSVKFYDGESVIKTVEVDDGKTVASYLPEKTGYSFVNFFSTPSMNHIFDFTKAITKDTNIYVGFSQYRNDTRVFSVVGSGKSNILATNNWGNGLTDKHLLTKKTVTGKNQYTVTCDLLVGDEFQFAINGDWHNKRGYGYVKNLKLADGTVVFSGAGGGYGDVAAKGKNIKVEKDGNYTFTLNTFPAEDFYNTEDAAYTETTKEVYNMNPFDYIEWTRNSDPIEESESIEGYFIKGSQITSWKNMFNPATMFTSDSEGKKFTLEVFLKADDEIMISSCITVGMETNEGTAKLNHDTLETAAKALFTEGGDNLVTVDEGTYTFTYDVATKKLNATVDKTKVPTERDYYIDGTFAGAWGDSLHGAADDRVLGEQEGSYKFIDDYKLVETVAGSGIYQILGVELKADSEIIIQSYKKGALEPGKHGTDGYNALGTYSYKYLLPNPSFEAANADGGNFNIKVKTAGKYNIIFNSYSKIINIVEGFDIYIKGSMNTWQHGFKADWKFTQSKTDDMLYELTLDFAKDAEFGIAQYNRGETSGDGSFIAKGAIGASGDSNAIFTGETGTNFKCSTAGKYKIVYNASSNKVDFYLVTA